MTDIRRRSVAAGIFHHQEGTMSDDRRIRIDLTPDQAQQIKQTSGREVSFIEFKVEELEQRIVPFCASGTHLPEVKL
jgi:hypothetical protein